MIVRSTANLWSPEAIPLSARCRVTRESPVLPVLTGGRAHSQIAFNHRLIQTTAHFEQTNTKGRDFR